MDYYQMIIFMNPAGKDGRDGIDGVGFKLTDYDDYNTQNKKLVNVTEGTENNDVIKKHQLETGLNSYLKTDGSNQMLAHINMGNRRIYNLGYGLTT